MTVPSNYIDNNGDHVYMLEFIKRNLSNTPCELCNHDLYDHSWVVLERGGSVSRCSKKEPETPKQSNLNESLIFERYVSYSDAGPLVMLRTVLESAYIKFKATGELYLGVWELKTSSDNSSYVGIDVRISPKFQLGGVDDNWRRPNYSFYPYIR